MGRQSRGRRALKVFGASWEKELSRQLREQTFHALVVLPVLAGIPAIPEEFKNKWNRNVLYDKLNRAAANSEQRPVIVQ